MDEITELSLKIYVNQQTWYLVVQVMGLSFHTLIIIIDYFVSIVNSFDLKYKKGNFSF